MNEWLVTMTSTLLGRLAGPLDEALGDHRAPAAQALVRADTDTCRQARSDTPGTSSSRSPDSVTSAHSRSRTTSWPSRRRRGPPRRRRTGRRLVVGEAALELVGAQVVAAALDEPVGRAAAEQRRERLGQARHVAVDDLRLQRQRRRGDDGGRAGLLGVHDGGDEVGERLAGAGARLDEQVLAACRRRRRRRAPSRPGPAARRRRLPGRRRAGARRGWPLGQGMPSADRGAAPSPACRWGTRRDVRDPGRRAPGVTVGGGSVTSRPPRQVPRRRSRSGCRTRRTGSPMRSREQELGVVARPSAGPASWRAAAGRVPRATTRAVVAIAGRIRWVRLAGVHGVLLVLGGWSF